MSSTQAQAEPRKFTGKHMIAVMVLFFGTIITVNMIMAWHATNSWTGLVVKNSYVASQHFNEVTQEKRDQLALGWASDIDYADGMLNVAMTDNNGAAIENAIVTAKLGRPAYEAEDQLVQFGETGTGQYATQADLGAGVWQADMTVTDAEGAVWTKSYRFLVKD